MRNENAPISACARLGYYPFSDYLRHRFGCKVHKVSLHAGFTCPNRDGTVGVGGCTYCVNESFNPQARNFRNSEPGRGGLEGKTVSPPGGDSERRSGLSAEALAKAGGSPRSARGATAPIGTSRAKRAKFQAGRPLRPIREQMADGMAYMRRRYHARKFIAYFQAFTNTYADVDTLRARYDEAVSFPDVVGLSIGTRPDCVPGEVLDLVQSYMESSAGLPSPAEAGFAQAGGFGPQADRLDVWLEYGLQSAHDRTLRRINRGHDVAAFLDAVERTRARGIKVCVHVILGLPGESWDDMMETARVLQPLGIDGIKLHHLYIVRGTLMEEEYRAGRIRLFSAGEYVSIACDFLERIPPFVTVQRLVGDTTSTGVLVAPVWPETKPEVLHLFTEEFRRRGTTQGARVPRQTHAPAVTP